MLDYDHWLTTDPRDSLPRCPECGAAVDGDQYDGWACSECEWEKPGPDPDKALDEIRDREWDQ